MLASQVAAVLAGLSGGASVLRRGVMLEHAPGSRNPVTWIDCLAFCWFGVFIIDQYDWTGTVTRSLNDDEIFVSERPGILSVQTSPLRRARPALRHLRALLAPSACPVECIAVFTASDCALDPALPENIIDASELHHFLRMRLLRLRASQSAQFDAARLAEHVRQHCADWGQC